MVKHTYTSEDFERYHSGKMTESEMHALERSALEDPFLADALEGYQNSATPVKDIEELKHRIQKKGNNKNVFYLQNKAWLRVAAAIILLTGIGFILYQANPAKQDQLAKNEIPITSKYKDSDPYTQPDLKNKNEVSSLNKTSDNKAPEPVHEAAASLHSNTNKRSLKTETAENNKRSDVPTADSVKEFKFETKDTSLNTALAARGYNSKQNELSPIAKKSMAVQSDNQKLQEVVVTANGVRRDNRYATKDAVNNSKAKTKSDPEPDSVEGPLGGWQRFNAYISDHIRTIRNPVGQRYTGQVILSFEVNRRGKAVHIIVNQSLCEECDEEATRLLRMGPKWKYQPGKTNSVTIHF